VADSRGAAKRVDKDAVRPIPRSRPRPERLDSLVHQRSRLAILSALATHDKLSFNDLKAILGATDGNLSVHARKLEEAGYIKCSKRFSGRVPLTEYELSRAGRSALDTYLAHMEAIIEAARAPDTSG